LQMPSDFRRCIEGEKIANSDNVNPYRRVFGVNMEEIYRLCSEALEQKQPQEDQVEALLEEAENQLTRGNNNNVIAICTEIIKSCIGNINFIFHSVYAKKMFTLIIQAYISAYGKDAAKMPFHNEYLNGVGLDKDVYKMARIGVEHLFNDIAPMPTAPLVTIGDNGQEVFHYGDTPDATRRARLVKMASRVLNWFDDMLIKIENVGRRVLGKKSRLTRAEQRENQRNLADYTEGEEDYVVEDANSASYTDGSMVDDFDDMLDDEVGGDDDTAAGGNGDQNEYPELWVPPTKWGKGSEDDDE